MCVRCIINSDEKGEKKLRPIKMREAMKLLGLEGFGIPHVHLRLGAASMEEALQRLLSALVLGRRLHRFIAMGDPAIQRLRHREGEGGRVLPGQGRGQPAR